MRQLAPAFRQIFFATPITPAAVRNPLKNPHCQRQEFRIKAAPAILETTTSRFGDQSGCPAKLSKPAAGTRREA